MNIDLIPSLLEQFSVNRGFKYDKEKLPFIPFGGVSGIYKGSKIYLYIKAGESSPAHFAHTREETTVKERNHRVCPVELSGRLDNRFRRWFQNPRKILRPYVAKGMTVLDIGCGPGFFSIDMAHLVGATGRVIALDLQEGMLQKLSKKIAGTELEGRFALQKCEADKLGVSEPVDFILAFYMFHEVADQDGLLDELGSILKPHGRVLIVEPPFHVSQCAFEQMIGKARKAGFALVETPKILFGKAAVLKRADQVLCPEEPKGGDPAP